MGMLVGGANLVVVTLETDTKGVLESKFAKQANEGIQQDWLTEATDTSC